MTHRFITEISENDFSAILSINSNQEYGFYLNLCGRSGIFSGIIYSPDSALKTVSDFLEKGQPPDKVHW